MIRPRPGWGAAVLAAATTVGCSMCGGPKIEKPPPPPVYTLCLEASPRLNWYADDSGPSAHTLYVKIYQLSARDAFNATDPTKLLSGDVPLPGAEGPPMARTLHPGTKASIEVVQQPNARFVGVVAGYFRLDGAGKVSRPFPPPTDEPSDDQEGADAVAPCIVLDANSVHDADK